jgi:hypothetical protein
MEDDDRGGEMNTEMNTGAVDVDYWEDLAPSLREEQDVRQQALQIDNLGVDWAWDDVHAKWLDLKLVREARMEEVGYMKDKGIWVEVDRNECFKNLGKQPVTVKWVDTNKGSDEAPAIRSRLVARDFRRKDDKDRQDLFAATPPLELKRMLMSKAASMSDCGRRRKLLFIDVKKAHLNPKCEADVYFEIPEEANPSPGKIGKLVYWLYGFRPAAQAWENCYAAKFVKEGFVRGAGASVVFWLPGKDLACVVHGDDFTFCGYEEDLDWVQQLMGGWFELKVRGRLGPDKNDDKEITILGRTVRWKEWGVEYEADTRHRSEILKHFGMNASTKGFSANGKAEDVDNEGDEEEVTGEEATAFRALAARANFLAQDCPDIQFPAKEVCRDMAVPKVGSWAKLKRLAKYLVSRESVKFRFEWQDDGQQMVVYTDSDWAGCRRTRKSTSGGAIMIGTHCIKTWSSTQGPIALSSAEAEYYSMVDGATRAKGMQTMGLEVGLKCLAGPITLCEDSSAAKSFASRRGLGKMRHVDTRELWLQEEVLQSRVVVRKVWGEENPADLMTKYLATSIIRGHLSRLCISVESADRGAAAEGGCRNEPPPQQQFRYEPKCLNA